MNFIKTHKSSATALAVGAGILLTACSGGGTVTSSSSGGNSGDISKLNMVAPNNYPSGIASTLPIVISNNGSTVVNNLNYTISSNTTGADISISTASAETCRIIPSGSSCTVQATIPANTASGSFAVTASQGNSTQNYKNTLSTTSITSSIVGLVTPATNNQSGADGITFYYSPDIITSETGLTQMIVTAYVSSAYAGSFNTINLVDASGNPLTNYTVLSGNSGNGLTNLTQGSIVTFLVTIPSGNSQFQFSGQTAKDGVEVSTASNSNTTSVAPAGSEIAILNVTPNYFSLTESHESQTITLSNSGNAAVSNLNITPQSPLTLVSNTCGSTIMANSSCSYTVKFDSKNPVAGTTGIIFAYGDGSTSSTTTVNYQGAEVIAGLDIKSSSDNFDFTARTKTPTVSSRLTITNTGNVAVGNFSYALPQNGYFTTNTTGITESACVPDMPLQPKQSCYLNLVYSNSTVTPTTTDTVTVNYHYNYAGDKTGSNTINLTYQTVQSQAQLVITSNPVTFPENILNNGTISTDAEVVITNLGDEIPSNFTVDITDINGMPAQLFSNTDTAICAAMLAAGQGNANCSVTFGPAGNSITAGTKLASFNVKYTPYNEAEVIGIEATVSTQLQGQVVAAQSASIFQGEAAASGFAAGSGPGTATANAYQVEQDAVQPTISYTITNSGPVPATDFYLVSNLPVGWNTDGGCGGVLTASGNITKVNLAAAGGSCTVKFTLSTTVSGAHNLDLSKVTMNWIDEDSPNGQAQPMTGMVYTSVYAPAI